VLTDTPLDLDGPVDDRSFETHELIDVFVLPVQNVCSSSWKRKASSLASPRELLPLSGLSGSQVAEWSRSAHSYCWICDSSEAA